MTTPGRLPAPMLASPLGRRDLPSGPGWVYEFKYDGMRAIAAAAGSALRLVSRNGNSVTSSFPELADLTRVLGGRAVVLDGEIVAIGAAGHPDFGRLQRRVHVAAPRPALQAAVPVGFVAFDVLHLDGEPVLHLPYWRRRELLLGLELDGRSPRVQVAAALPGVDGEHALDAARQAAMEGVIAKRLNALYRPGERSKWWIKRPLIQTQEAVVIGYVTGDGRRAGRIGALLLAVATPEGGWRYIGSVGTGFTSTALRELQTALDAIPQLGPAAPDVPRDHARGARWVAPQLVGEIAFRCWTGDRRVRHAVWRGQRPDREPATVVDTATVEGPPGAGPVVQGALRTRDGRWRVEVLTNDGAPRYRIVHQGGTVDYLLLADVEGILAAAGVGLDQLTDAA